MGKYVSFKLKSELLINLDEFVCLITNELSKSPHVRNERLVFTVLINY